MTIPRTEKKDIRYILFILGGFILFLLIAIPLESFVVSSMPEQNSYLALKRLIKSKTLTQVIDLVFLANSFPTSGNTANSEQNRSQEKSFIENTRLHASSSWEYAHPTPTKLAMYMLHLSILCFVIITISYIGLARKIIFQRSKK